MTPGVGYEDTTNTILWLRIKVEVGQVSFRCSVQILKSGGGWNALIRMAKNGLVGRSRKYYK